MKRMAEPERTEAPARAAEIVREFGPFPGAERIHGVTHDGRNVWAATGARLIAIDPESGQPTRGLDRACDAGTAFDGKYLYQIAEKNIDKIDPASGEVVRTLERAGDAGTAFDGKHLYQIAETRIDKIDRKSVV